MEELLYVLQSCRIQIGHRSDEGMFIGKVIEHSCWEQLEQHAVRLVVNPQTTLFLYRIALVIKILLGNI